jgi:hypothetical protein
MSAYSLDYVKSHRNMPFLKRGMRLEMNGRRGKVTCGYGGYVRVKFDDVRFTRNCHPQWEMVYYSDDGKIIRDYRGQEG